MEYYKLIGLDKEPFSNSPDPGLFFRSASHGECLNLLEIGIRLRRGLHVVCGEVGTGKTTLSRMLIRSLSEDSSIKVLLILDPQFESSYEFTSSIYSELFNTIHSPNLTRRELLERIKKEIHRISLYDNKNIVFIIDEGQGLNIDSIETIREILNFETNSEKLVQFVIFAQNEFFALIDKTENFKDRINELIVIDRLSFEETRELIQWRIAASGHTAPTKIFPKRTCKAIYKITKGRPRQTIKICHKALVNTILNNKDFVSSKIVKSCIAAEEKNKINYKHLITNTLLITSLTLIASLAFMTIKSDNTAITDNNKTTITNSTQKEITSAASLGIEFNQSINQKLSTGNILLSNETASKVEKRNHGLNAFESIGHISARNGHFISRMIDRVYGVYRNSYYEYLKRINHQIQDFDNPKQGQKILFPKIVFDIPRDYSDNRYIIVIKEFKSLDEAYNFIMSNNDNKEFMRLVTTSDNENNFKYRILAPGSYSTRQEADLAVNRFGKTTHFNMEIKNGFSDKEIAYHNFNVPQHLDWRTKKIKLLEKID